MEEQATKPMDKFKAKLDELRAQALKAAQKALSDLACWDQVTISEGPDHDIRLTVAKDGLCFSKSYRYSAVEVACIAFDIGALALHFDVKSDSTQLAIVSYGWIPDARGQGSGPSPAPGRDGGDRAESVKPLTLSEVPSTQPEFGLWLQAMRQAAGVTRQELADTADMKFTTIQNIEAGRNFALAETRTQIVSALTKLGGELLEGKEIAPLDPRRRGNPHLGRDSQLPARHS